MFCLPVTVIAAIVPVVLDVPYVSSAQLGRICAASLTVGAATVVVGTVQDFSHFSADLPAWIRTAVVVVFVPFILGLVVLISAHNHLRLARTLDATLDANDRLRGFDEELRRSRARLVAAAERERRLIGRDLHDGAQQRLIALGLGMAHARAVVARRPAEAVEMMARLEDDLTVAVAELRHLAHGLHPPLLADLGLALALTDATDRLGRPCRAEFGGLGRYPAEVEAAVYFCCIEALQNAVKHAGDHATVTLDVNATDAGGIVFAVTDTGVGFDPALARNGRGLTNIADRVGAVGGELLLSSAVGRGTTVRGTLPPPDISPCTTRAIGADYGRRAASGSAGQCPPAPIRPAAVRRRPRG
jgi:signal transduction histidine kinase